MDKNGPWRTYLTLCNHIVSVLWRFMGMPIQSPAGKTHGYELTTFAIAPKSQRHPVIQYEINEEQIPEMHRYLISYLAQSFVFHT